MHEPDADLVRAAASGDARAFEQLVRECHGPLRRFLAHLVGDDAAADDLTQDVLVKVHRQLATYRFESRFMTWLLRIARNAAADARRSEHRRRARELHAAEVRPASDPFAVGEIAGALASLPTPLREALLLVEVYGLSYAEAGALLDVPEGTAKSRVHRAREGVASWFERPRAERGRA